jgi:purine nucleoside phosphorylase
MAEGIRIGVIGGSGLYGMAGLKVEGGEAHRDAVGRAFDPLRHRRARGQAVAFLARHGKGHRILPSEINFRANVFGFKTLGVEWLISVSAVGLMKLEYAPLDIVVPDQFYDRTHRRPDTSSATAWWRTFGGQADLHRPDRRLRRGGEGGGSEDPQGRRLPLRRGRSSRRRRSR